MNEYITVKEALVCLHAVRVFVEPPAVRQYVYRKKVHGIKRGGVVFLSYKSLMEYIRERTL